MAVSLRVTVVGSSFVRRLRDDIDHGAHEVFEGNFGLAEVSVSYVCQGGWKVEDVRANLHQISQQRPDFVVLQIGSNDLCKPSHPLNVAEDILALAEEIKWDSRASGSVSEFRQGGRKVSQVDGGGIGLQNII
jgi:lysophospholipase L1-like esterase